MTEMISDPVHPWVEHVTVGSFSFDSKQLRILTRTRGRVLAGIKSPDAPDDTRDPARRSLQP